MREPLSSTFRRETVGRGAISVVVPAWNGLPHTRACLHSLRAAGIAEVVVVDNGSTDGTSEWLENERGHRPDLHVVRLPSNQGFAAGCNAGLRETRGELVVILNNDTAVPPDTMHRLAAAWQRVPRAGLVAPVSNYVKGRQCVTLAEGEDEGDLEMISARLTREHPGAIEETDSLAGLCLLTHRSVLEEVGLLDERYGLGNFEDDDLCLRVRQAGYRLLIVRDAYVQHTGNATFHALGIDYEEQYAAQAVIHAEKWYDDPLFRIESLAEAEPEAPPARLARIEELARALAPDSPAWVWSRPHVARALEAAERVEEAIEPWQTFVRHHPLHTEATAHLAFALLLTGHEEEGRHELARMLFECHLDAHAGASVLTRLARWCHDAGYGPEAREHLATALALAPDFVPAWNTHAVWMLEEGHYREAEACLIPFRDQRDGDVLANLGIAQWHQGRPEEAVASFAEGVEVAGPESPAGRNLEMVRAAIGGSAGCA